MNYLSLLIICFTILNFVSGCFLEQSNPSTSLEQPPFNSQLNQNKKPDLFLIKKDGKTGFINVNGKIQIKPQFDDAYGFREGLAAIRVGDLWGFINSKGFIVIKPKFQEVQNFSEGLAAIEIKNEWGFIDRSGKIAIQPQFCQVRPFSERYAIVSNSTNCYKFGFINMAGKITIEPQFSEAESFQEGLAAVKITRKGFFDLYFLHGFINYSGQEVIPFRRFGYGRSFSEGIANFRSMGKELYIDKTGKIFLETDFDYASPFVEGMAQFGTGDIPNRKYGFIDRTGKLVIGLQFDNASLFSEGMAVVKIGDKWGVIDKTGKMLIKPQFPQLYTFMGGLARVDVGDKWGYIDKTGKFVWEPTN